MTSTPVPVRRTLPGRARSARREWDRRGWIFVAPFLIVFALTFLAPIAYAAQLSLFRVQLFFGGSTFVGLDNYAVLLGDSSSGHRSCGCWCSC